MISLPTPPTDNLYKFMAIIGSIMIVCSLYYPFIMKNEIEEKHSDVELKIKTIVAEIEFIKSKAETIKNIVQNSIAVQKGRWKNDSNKLELQYSDEELKEYMVQLDELIKSIQIKIAEKDHLVAEEKRLFSHMGSILWIAISINLVGSVSSVTGFTLWYFRIQRIQDVQLKNSINANNTN